MKYLLDTHILFWALSAEDKLPEEALKCINDPENDIFFSSASVWEVVIKHSKNPVNMPCIKLVSIFKILKTGDRAMVIILVIPLAFKIDIMLENNTIKPPIISIVEILFVMLSAITSPRL